MLYQVYFGNVMEMIYGWLMQKYSYIVVDIDGFIIVYVNLVIGVDSMFSGVELNYFFCFGNELVISLDVYFNGDELLCNVVVKVGE